MGTISVKCYWCHGLGCAACGGLGDYPGPDYAHEPNYDDYPEDREDAKEMRDE